MDEKVVANYLASLLKKTNLTYESAAAKCNTSESTIKNLCLAKTENPGVLTVSSIVYPLGGSIDEMLNPTKSKDEIKEFTIASIKEIYEQQLADAAKMSEAHINNIRSHYEQHIEDLKENFEKRLNDKKEIIKEKSSQVTFLKILACAGLVILVGLLIAEVMNPSLGWLRF